MTDARCGTATSRVKNREWIEELLDRPDMVEWDRFTVGDTKSGQLVTVYGWIDREDEYKDFVVVRFWTDKEWIGFTTSSDAYTEELQVLWFGEDSLDDHNPCRRVEHTFDVENAIELHEQTTLADGGRSAEQAFFRCPNGHTGRVDADQLAGDISIICDSCEFHGYVADGEVLDSE